MGAVCTGGPTGVPTEPSGLIPRTRLLVRRGPVAVLQVVVCVCKEGTSQGKINTHAQCYLCFLRPLGTGVARLVVCFKAPDSVGKFRAANICDAESTGVMAPALAHSWLQMRVVVYAAISETHQHLPHDCVASWLHA